jgi:Fur family ferric uptake transcriptional regulator
MAYKTSQRKALNDLFSSNPNRAFTAKEIIAALESFDISASAVYRNLSTMVNEGRIRRAVNKMNRESVYQFVGCNDTCTKIHLTCTECGMTQHVDPKTASAVYNSAGENDGFEINTAKTVLYGTCKACKAK